MGLQSGQEYDMFEDEASVPGREERREQGEMKLPELAGPGHQGLVVS